MCKYLLFKVWLWYSKALACLLGTPRKVLFSKAVKIPSFEDVRVTGHIPTSTTVFLVFVMCTWYQCLTFLHDFGKGGKEGGILADRILAIGVQIQIQKGKNEKALVSLQVRMEIKHMHLSDPVPFLFMKQI